MQEHARALAERGDATEALRLSVKILADRNLDKNAEGCLWSLGKPSKRRAGGPKIRGDSMRDLGARNFPNAPRGCQGIGEVGGS